MVDDLIFHVKPALAAGAHVSAARHRLMCNHALRDPEPFWLEQARRLDWMQPPTLAGGGGFDGDARVTWFADGTLNASVNCLDRHLAERGEQTALIWQGEDEDEGEDGAAVRRWSFRALHGAVCRLANVLRAQGVRRGDRVAEKPANITTCTAPMRAQASIAPTPSATIGR